MVRRAVVAGTALVVGVTIAAPALANDPPPAPAVVDGTVTVAGVLKAGATVRLTDPVSPATPAVEATTDDAGHYSVPVTAGSYLICAGMKDNSVHHSCTPGSTLGTDAHTWTLAAGGQQTLDFTLASSDLPLGGELTPSYAAWVRRKTSYRLVRTAGPIVYRPAKSAGSRIDVVVDAVRTFNGAEVPFEVGAVQVPGFRKYPDWGPVGPLPSVLLESTVYEDESCGVAVDQGASRPPQMWAVPKVVEQVRTTKGAVLLDRPTAVGEAACRRDRLTLGLRGAVRDGRRQLRLSARTDSAVQSYRPVVRVYSRSSGKLLGTGRLRIDGSIKPIALPRKFHKRTLKVRVVLPPSDGSPQFVVRRTVSFPRR